MPIELRYYKNLFWAEGNVKPNRIPDPQKRDIVARQPRMYDFFNGYIKLYGLWNYAIYEGRHYFLDILYRFDEKRQSYGYSMRLDIWTEALKRKPTLKGILNVSNNDELLNEHLQYTYPTLLEPANSKRINFVEKAFDWRKQVIKKKANPNIKQYVITADSWQRFINAHRSRYAQAYINDWSRKFFNDPGTDAIYIFDYLRLGSLQNGWKSWLIRKVNKFLDELGDNHKIAKCTTPANSALVGRYCITSKIEGIGGGEENVDIDLIDLSGLKDVVEVRASDLGGVLVPETDFSLDTAIFNIEGEKHDADFGFKVCRKFYGSFVSRNQRGRLRGTGLGSWVVDETDILYYRDDRYGNYVKIDCQTRGSETSSVPLQTRDTAYFNWGINNPVQCLKFKAEAAGVEEHISYGITYWVDRINFTLNFATRDLLKAVRDEKPNKLLFPYPHYFNVDAYYSYVNDEYFRKMDNAPGYGFLIYQTIRNWHTWNTIEYKGDIKLNSLKVITGLNKVFHDEYGSDKLSWLPTLVPQDSGIKGNMGVLLFYLDYFSFLHFTPTDKNYDYAYGNSAWAQAFKLNSLLKGGAPTWYVPLDTKTDLNLNGTIVENPFTNERYGAHADKRLRILNSVTIQEELLLEDPKNPEVFGGLEKGDYFFTDLEYALSDIRNRNPNNLLNVERFPNDRCTDYRWINPETATNRKSIGILSDFVRRWEEENQQHYFDVLKNTLVLCSTKDKKLEIRLFQYFKKTHSLDTSSRQILYSVNGNIDQEVKYIRLKNLGIEIDPTKQDIPDEVKLRIIKQFYETNSYKIEGNKWSWVNIEDLEKSPRDRIFDLVGTSWYVHIKKGKVSLIAKDTDTNKQEGRFENLFKPKREKINTLEPVEGLKNLTLLEKVNQKCFLNIHTDIRPIRAKFDFSKTNNFDITLQTPKASRLPTGSNYYILQIKDKFDVVDREILAIPKLPTDAVDIAASAQIEQQRLLALRAQQDYDLAMGRLETRESWIEEEYRRQGWDLSMQKWKFGLNLAGEVAGMAAKFAPLPGKAAALYGAYEMMDDYLAYVQGLPGVQSAEWQSVNPAITNAQTDLMRKGKSFINQGIGTIAGTIMQAMHFKETQKRADFNREMAVRNLNISKTQTSFIHERAKQDSAIHINSLSNVYRKQPINDAYLVEEVNKMKDLNDGQEMQAVHLTVYTPSAEQLKYLIDHKERHGVDCFIPNQTYKFYFGMSPDVIRFKDLYDEELTELSLPELRKAFLAMIYAGVKIVNVEESHLIEETEEERLNAELTLEKDINKRLEGQNQELEVKNTELGTKVTDLENAKEGLEKVKSELTAKADKLTAEITQINAEIQKKQAEVTKLETDLKSATTRAETLSASVKRLEGELTTTNNVKNLLQAEVNQMRPKVQELQQLEREKTELKTKIKTLTNTVGELANKVHSLTNQIAALTGGTIAWTYEGVPKPQENQSLEAQIAALQNQLNALSNISSNVEGTVISHHADFEGKVAVDREETNLKAAIGFKTNILDRDENQLDDSGVLGIFRSFLNFLLGGNNSFENFLNQAAETQQGQALKAKILNKRNELLRGGWNKSNRTQFMQNFMWQPISYMVDFFNFWEEVVTLIINPLPGSSENLFSKYYSSDNRAFVTSFLMFLITFNWITKEPLPQNLIDVEKMKSWTRWDSGWYEHLDNLYKKNK